MHIFLQILISALVPTENYPQSVMINYFFNKMKWSQKKNNHNVATRHVHYFISAKSSSSSIEAHEDNAHTTAGNVIFPWNWIPIFYFLKTWTF